MHPTIVLKAWSLTLQMNFIRNLAISPYNTHYREAEITVCGGAALPSPLRWGARQ
jgi:hypothetical protein